MKLNGLSGGQHGASTISWDHFFASLQQYFSNLRQEQPLSQTMLPVGDTIYHPHTRPMTRGISPAEIKGLASVLRLLQAVADNCEAARVALAENSAWQPLLVFSGLLGCPVPAELKSELLRSLASVSKSSDIAHIVWQNVESAQLITTVPSMGVVRSGLGMELESMETRAEEYPISRAFLHLLDVLTDSSIPGTLGSGNRPPGFEPYLAYVRDALFLKFNARAYRDPSEKWEIVAGCLNFFCKILVEYAPQPADFVKASQSEPPVVGKHPGYFLLLDLFQSSELLRLLLFIIDECCAVLEKYQPFPGKEMVEKSCLLALKLLNIALSTERAFLEAAKAANSPVLLTALSQLLQGINPRSGRPDHMLGIAKFVTFAWWQPTAALHAIQIISAVSDSPGSQQGLLAAFTSSGEKVAQNIIKGFTDILDNDEEEDQISQGNAGVDSKSLSTARIHVVQMLLNGLDKPAPSISHFLLGFNLKEPLSKSNLQPPGVLGSIRTPFHAILSFLRPASARVPNPSIQRSPNMCEASYRLIYHLSANLQTSEPTLRYLRSSEDFLSTQLTLLPLPDELASSTPILKGVSWLLKTVAIELKLVSAARLRSQVTLLIQLLLEAQSPGQVDRNDESVLGVTTVEEAALSQLSRSAAIPNGTTRMTSGALTSTFQVGSSGQQQHRLLQMLNSIDFEEESLPTPKWEVFDSAQVSQVLKGCEQKGLQGEKLINVQALHKILNDELVGLQGSAALNQRQIIQDEIKR